jgi:hypothetical protein
MTLIRGRVSHVSVLIPQAAYSAATLLAMGADEIFMHPHGNLGPVDPQIHMQAADGEKRFAAEDVTAFLRFAKEDVGLTDQDHVRALLEKLCEEVGGLALGFAARSSQLSVSLGEKLLRLHMNHDGDIPRARSIARSLCSDFYDHGYAVGRDEARDLGLKVKPDKSSTSAVDLKTESLIWKIWKDFEAEFESRVKFSPVQMLLQNTAAAGVLLAPVVQVNIPAGTPQNVANTAYQNAISVQTIDPIDVELCVAAVESARHTTRLIDKRKILGRRMPDLSISYQCPSVWSGWKSVATPEAKEKGL